jgi:hypothetical protein
MRVRLPASLLVLLLLAVIGAGCSSGQTSAPDRHAALVALQKLTDDENTLNRAEGEYSQGTAAACPQSAGATPTLPSKPLTCSNLPPADSAQMAQLKAAVVKAQTQLVTDRKAYVQAKGDLPGLPNPPTAAG